MKKYFIILVLLTLAIFISGCIGLLTTPGDDSIAPGRGRLEIYLTDAPGDYLEVNITISKIEAHIAGGGEEPWQILKEWDVGDELEVDLKKVEDVSILLASLELVPNKYTQLRIFLKDDEDEDAWLILNDEYSTEVPLVIPSVYQTGIKLIHPFEIIEGEITKLTIDFDAEKSVVKTDTGEYELKPVIKVTSEIYLEADIDTGSVSGTVYYVGGDSELIVIEGASVSFTLYGGEYIFTTSIVTEQDGSFFIEQLPIGTYILKVSAEDYIDHTQDEIEVTKDEITDDIDIVLTRIP